MPYSYAVTARSRAHPATVFSTLLRASTWPSWSPIDAAGLEDGGDPGTPQGVGDTRVFRTGRTVSRERIVDLAENRRFGYENVGGPFRSYQGTIALAETPEGGTDIIWTAVFEPKLPLSGPLWRWYLTRFMQRMADGLAAYAEATDADEAEDADADAPEDADADTAGA
ncbi:SRPBCC family protein [Streptomyces albiaxialis]|uniref:SRPBCC family protein n=1 Tax=Streptomyces albiaxialis TaxID=329523 RepID=A0ABP5HCR0_9ACTN